MDILIKILLPRNIHWSGKADQCISRIFQCKKQSFQKSVERGADVNFFMFRLAKLYV